jgi:hypothetical protein
VDHGGSLLHHEFDVTVVAVHHFGLQVEFDDGRAGQIINLKGPDWLRGAGGDVVGKVVHAVVLDDDRDPIRLSALESDIEAAREASRRGQEIEPIGLVFLRRRFAGTL